jgi:hypothetical protein
VDKIKGNLRKVLTAKAYKIIKAWYLNLWWLITGKKFKQFFPLPSRQNFVKMLFKRFG